MFRLHVTPHEGTSLIGDSAGWAYLEASAARDARGLAPGQVRIAVDHGFTAAISQTQGVISHNIAAGTFTTTAKNTAIVLHE